MIIGKNVYLRPIKKDDLEILNQWKNDSEVFKYLGGGFQPISIDQQEQWMNSLIDLTGINKRFIISNQEDYPLGMVGLYKINWIHRTCEIGIYIGQNESRGKGYGKEAVSLLEAYGKSYLNIRKVKLNVVMNNKRALNMWSNLDYDKVGMLKKERYIDGEYYDLGIMEKFL